MFCFTVFDNENQKFWNRLQYELPHKKINLTDTQKEIAIEIEETHNLSSYIAKNPPRFVFMK